jgi:hypothetical protein
VSSVSGVIGMTVLGLSGGVLARNLLIAAAAYLAVIGVSYALRRPLATRVRAGLAVVAVAAAVGIVWESQQTELVPLLGPAQLAKASSLVDALPVPSGFARGEGCPFAPTGFPTRPSLSVCFVRHRSIVLTPARMRRLVARLGLVLAEPDAIAGCGVSPFTAGRKLRPSLCLAVAKSGSLELQVRETSVVATVGRAVVGGITAALPCSYCRAQHVLVPPYPGGTQIVVTAVVTLT